MIYVMQPAMPPLKDFVSCLETIWESKWLTNEGPFHQAFESELAEYCGLEHVSIFSNGTLALITALRALQITGEVITTPYSFVATSHALWWNGIEPVFVDIEPEYMNMDPKKIEAAITPRTTAILPVHVYGNPCDVDAIKKIADEHGLKVIYDAAHAFGVKKDGVSILHHGDLSILSFHATKVFNCFEGGAIVCHTPEMKRHIDNLKNFGFRDEVTVEEPGINGKMNELQAAYGRLQLKRVDDYIDKRKRIAYAYRSALAGVQGIRFLNDQVGVVQGYPYFPILVQEEYGMSRDGLYEYMKRNGVHARRYFYPLISHFDPYRRHASSVKENLKVAEAAASEVLCLPIYPDLEMSDVMRISALIRERK